MSGPPSRTVHNERTKLTATFLNGTAIASIAAGVVTPLAALTFGLGTAPGRDTFAITGLTALWLVGGLLLHYLARRALEGLRE